MSPRKASVTAPLALRRTSRSGSRSRLSAWSSASCSPSETTWIRAHSSSNRRTQAAVPTGLKSLRTRSSGSEADSSYSASSRIIAAKAGGSSVATLPLYLASNARACSSSRSSVASIFGSSGDTKRSVRFQRTSSAPVVLSASTINDSGYSVNPLGHLPHSPRIRPAPRVRAFVDRVGQFLEKRRPHRLLVLQRRLRWGATPAQASLHLFVEAQKLVVAGRRPGLDLPAAAAEPGVREDDNQADRDRGRDHGEHPQGAERLRRGADAEVRDQTCDPSRGPVAGKARRRERIDAGRRVDR